MNERFNRFLTKLGGCGRVLILLILLVFLLCPAEDLKAAPGSGTAVIAPSGDVTAGTLGKWTITYTAAEGFSGGEISLLIPAGWTLPQSANNSEAGYVTVSGEGTLAADPISITVVRL